MEGGLPFFYLAPVSPLHSVLATLSKKKKKKKTSHIWENLCSDHKTQSFHYFHHYFLGVRFMLISRSLLQLSSILGKHHLYHLKEELLTDSSDRLLEV